MGLMSAYIIGTVTVSDPDRYADYTRHIAGLSEAHGGETIVKGMVKEVVEGDAPQGERMVIVRFPDAEAARAYLRSERYQEGKAKREGAASITMRLIEG
jgi:uncharacterized protein (DUF1330 family)